MLDRCTSYCGVACVNGYCPNANFDGFVSKSFKKMRSKTFPGIANAFAEQFSTAILSGDSFSLPYQTFLKDVIL